MLCGEVLAGITLGLWVAGAGGGGGRDAPVVQPLPAFMPCMDPNCRLNDKIVVVKMWVYLGLGWCVGRCLGLDLICCASLALLGSSSGLLVWCVLGCCLVGCDIFVLHAVGNLVQVLYIMYIAMKYRKIICA